MTILDSWGFDLEGYIRQGEPDQAVRAGNWQTAIGLQAVDGLKTSDYLLETAREHIEGAITIDEVERRIESYYEERAARGDREAMEAREGDTVSSRITRLLGERAFTFSPAQLKSIHRRLFAGILPLAGEYRPYNITKKEWVLKGDTVLYASADSIVATLDYNFARERGFSYRGLGKDGAVRHLASFIAGIWQIHPFAEGNTRTTAVFAIKYLSSLGYQVDNDPFKRHSWYFRNALVRANYENIEAGVFPTQRYLDAFFENLLLGGANELRNRELHVDWPMRQGETTEGAESKATDQVTDQVRALLEVLGDSELSAAEIMAKLGLSHRPTFRRNYLNPALAAGLVERTIPEKPTSRLQKYRKPRS